MLHTTEIKPQRVAGSDLREELQAAFPLANLHPIDCDCGKCLPVAVGEHRSEKVVRVQAALLGMALVAFYALALVLTPHILAAFQPVPSHIELSPATVGVAGPATPPATVGLDGPATRSHR